MQTRGQALPAAPAITRANGTMHPSQRHTRVRAISGSRLGCNNIGPGSVSAVNSSMANMPGVSQAAARQRNTAPPPRPGQSWGCAQRPMTSSAPLPAASQRTLFECWRRCLWRQRAQRTCQNLAPAKVIQQVRSTCDALRRRVQAPRYLNANLQHGAVCKDPDLHQNNPGPQDWLKKIINLPVHE